MPKHSVRYNKQAATLASRRDPVALDEGIKRVKEMAGVGADRGYKGGRKRTGFDQTVELVVHLGIDAKQADQALRGSFSFPKGIGKAKRVIAFCEGADAEAAKAAGAIEVGVDDLVQRIENGWMDFDVAVAVENPEVMGKVRKLGRTLGPTGKMPTPKSGTVTKDIGTTVREFAAGKVEYRNDDGGNLHVVVGKASFVVGDLAENIEAFIAHVQKIKPPAAKGQYIKRVCLSATMTPSVTLAVG